MARIIYTERGGLGWLGVLPTVGEIVQGYKEGGFASSDESPAVFVSYGQGVFDIAIALNDGDSLVASCDEGWELIKKADRLRSVAQEMAQEAV